jgi:hypothetical protein
MTELDPDQLLKSVDLQIAAARFRRGSSTLVANRNAIRMAGVLFLVLGTTIALFAMQYIATDFVNTHQAPARQEAPAKPNP